MAANIQNLGKQTLRGLKNYTKGFSDTQQKVREATSNDAWGPSGTLMNELSQMTYNQQDFVEIMELLDKRLNDKGKNWRHVFKALTLLDYLLHAGSENVVIYFKENLYIIKTLKEFVHVDDDGKDQGANVRQKAKEITSLLLDDARLREERKGRASMRDRLSGAAADDVYREERPQQRRPSRSNARSNNSNREEDDMRRAIEESKRMAEDEARRNRGNNANDGDADLEKAMRLSREEDERRKAALSSYRNGLFDADRPSDQLIDFTSNQSQQPAVMPQYTGMPQFNSYNPYAAQQQAQQEEYMRMQQQLEMQRQMEAQQQAAAYQQMLQQQAYMQQQQQAQLLQAQQTAAPLVPQATAFGSNNPFASFANSSPPSQPSLPTFKSSPDLNAYTPPATASPTPIQRPPSAPAPATRRNDEQHAQLAALLGSGGSGIDTYGNVGNLRLPAGSPFHSSNRTAASGGTNPFGAAVQPQPTGYNPQQQAAQPNSQPFFSL